MRSVLSFGLDFVYVSSFAWFVFYVGFQLAHFLKSKDMLTTLKISETLEDQYMGVVQRAVIYIRKNNNDFNYRDVEQLVIKEIAGTILEQPHRKMESDIEYILHREFESPDENITFSSNQ